MDFARGSHAPEKGETRISLGVILARVAAAREKSPSLWINTWLEKIDRLLSRRWLELRCKGC
jgi:hypothetical protein